MQDEKTADIVNAVMNMSDCEVGILEVFLAGLRAGKQVSRREREGAPTIPPPAETGSAQDTSPAAGLRKPAAASCGQKE